MSIFRIVVVLAVCLFGAYSSFSETKKLGDYVVWLKTTKPEAIYKVGDKAEFEIKIFKDGKPFDGAELSCVISKDGVAPLSKKKVSNSGAVHKFIGSLDEPGFLKCAVSVKFPDQKKQLAMLCGAGFEPEKILPSLPAPEDFQSYWDAQKAMLAKIPMNMKLQLRNNVLAEDKSLPKKIKDAIDVYIVKADTFNGILDAYLFMPKNAKAKSLPLVILPHGAGVRYSRFCYGVEFAAAGYMAIDFNALGLDSDGTQERLKELKKENAGYWLKKADNRDTNFFRTMYLRLCRAMDVGMAQPQWDGKNLIVYGTSQGGAQALAAGGLYRDKVSLVCAFVPALCDQTGMVKNRINGWPHYIKPDKDGKYGQYDKNLFEAIRYVDAMNFAPLIKAPVIFVVNLSDDVCQPSSCFAAYANIKAPKTLITNPEARHAVPQSCYSKVKELIKGYMK